MSTLIELNCTCIGYKNKTTVKILDWLSNMQRTSIMNIEVILCRGLSDFKL